MSNPARPPTTGTQCSRDNGPPNLRDKGKAAANLLTANILPTVDTPSAGTRGTEFKNVTGRQHTKPHAAWINQKPDRLIG
mmetsp:Transcript_31883/g.30397  ORF Transcript_31883/g.30397 Transcript_31883/m.30397 type:complete len:80 (-) Transcript_31883:510-749(-)